MPKLKRKSAFFHSHTHFLFLSSPCALTARPDPAGSDRRAPEAHPIIDTPAAPSEPVQRPYKPSTPAAPPSSSRSTRKPKSSKQSRAKAEKAVQNADKLAHRAAMNNLRAEKKKRAKA